MVQGIAAPPTVGREAPGDVARRAPPRHRLPRIRRRAARAAAGGAPPALFRRDGVEPLHRRPLDALVCHRRVPEGPLAAIRLRDRDPLDRRRMGGSSLQPVGPLLPVLLQRCSIGRPGLAIDAWGRVPVAPLGRCPPAIHVLDLGPPRRQRRRALSPDRCPEPVERLVQGAPAL
jgi:hypothetical protein